MPTGWAHSSRVYGAAKGMFVVTGAVMPGGASPWMETIVAILLNVSLLVLVGCALILWPSRSASGK